MHRWPPPKLRRLTTRPRYRGLDAICIIVCAVTDRAALLKPNSAMRRNAAGTQGFTESASSERPRLIVARTTRLCLSRTSTKDEPNAPDYRTQPCSHNKDTSGKLPDGLVGPHSLMARQLAWAAAQVPPWNGGNGPPCRPNLALPPSNGAARRLVSVVALALLRQDWMLRPSGLCAA